MCDDSYLQATLHPHRHGGRSRNPARCCGDRRRSRAHRRHQPRFVHRHDRDVAARPRDGGSRITCLFWSRTSAVNRAVSSREVSVAEAGLTVTVVATGAGGGGGGSTAPSPQDRTSTAIAVVAIAGIARPAPGPPRRPPLRSGECASGAFLPDHLPGVPSIARPSLLALPALPAFGLAFAPTACRTRRAIFDMVIIARAMGSCA